MNLKQHKTFIKSVLALAIVGTISATVNATTNPDTATTDELETITVTASRSPMSIADSLASQVVITRADIERIQPKSVLDLLTSVAGIDMSTNGGRGQNSSVYMRGANSGHTLVLLNGVRISSATLGSTNVQDIAPELIERIEIVKGPRAALWGSDAIGGVIQIFTRKLAGGEHQLSAGLGSQGYKLFNGSVGLSHGDGATSFSVSHEKSDGFDVKDDSETDEDGYRYDSFAVNGQQKVNSALSLNWLAQVDQGETEYDSGGANQSDVNNHVWHLGAKLNWLASGIANVTEFGVSQNRTSSIGYGNGTRKSEGLQYDSRRQQYSLLNSSKLSQQWHLNLGADFYQETLKGDAQYDRTERDVSGVFAHAMYHQDKFSFELATRYDDVEGIDSETTYNTSAGYQLTEHTKVSVSAGTGFKAPTFNDLYYPLGWNYIGNPELVSETSTSYEFSVSSYFESVSLVFNLYQTDIEQLIDWSGSTEEGYVTPVNVDDVEIQGAELGINYQGFGGVHKLNVSYIEAEDASTGKQLGRRAKHHLSYQFDKTLGNADVYAEVQFKGKRYDYPYGGGAVKLDGYSLVNLGVNYALSNKVKLQAKINNAFKHSYQNTDGYFTQGRVVYFGISYQN
ncbi:TonB-dependent receptor [Thalassotalea insulae]|uniref:TonB-dependent receptor n=1 Tax=Thalassotalea insulae TaxID=2056778 RepID=A0ABQ6GUZ6_9GAMM|nr:TonB-dependent receptor [Thalassotalea insulae]GLX79758.1 TonB-dependent receptor [Thalassotalea insulae]